MNRVLQFIGLLFIIVVFNLVPELIGGDLSDMLKDKLGENYLYFTIGAGVVALIIGTLWSDGGRIFGKKPKDAAQTVSQDNLASIRNGLLDSYQARLKSKMAYCFPINLEIEYSTEGSDAKIPLYDNVTIQDKAIRAPIAEIFHKHNGRLLIIGQPGSGKTTLLLELACALMQNETEQIPIIVNIATWRSRFKTVEDWLSELLPQMGFSKALVKQLLNENRLLLLLDGLDELKSEENKLDGDKNNTIRTACLGAIAQSGVKQKARYVICSRIVEYTATMDAPVHCQIKVKPLTIPQIEQGLRTTLSPESKGMLQAIQQDLLLAKAIQTPFYFNTVQLLFASMKSWTEFGFVAKKSTERKTEIVNTFVNEASNRFKNVSPTDSKKWLGFLAHQMNKHGLVSFELLDIQYDWATLSKGQKRWASSLEGLLEGLPKKNIFIRSKDRISWSFSRFWVFIKKKSKDILLLGLLLGLLFGLLGDMFWSMFLGLFFGLFFGLFWGMFLGLLDQFENTQSYLKITSPYQRFIASAWRLHFSILQHWHLRGILHRQGLLPKKLVAFLEEATKHHILEKDGGTWRFRHRILQDYFADYYQKNHPP